jgi:hypothetical protein
MVFQANCRNLAGVLMCVHQHKERAKSSGSDGNWKELADEVKKYTSMSSDDRSDCSSEDSIDDNDNKCGDNNQIHMDLDRDQEDADESLIDQCEESVEQQELNEMDLALEPISVGEHCEACVLLSKVCDFIFLQGPH